MRGYVEESPEVKARRALQVAAKAYAARYLTSFSPGDAEGNLTAAALAYAEATRPAKRNRRKAAPR